MWMSNFGDEKWVFQSKVFELQLVKFLDLTVAGHHQLFPSTVSKPLRLSNLMFFFSGEGSSVLG